MITLIVVILIFVLILVIWALYSKGEEAAKVTEEQQPEDKDLRRRTSDKEIEEKFSDSEGHPFRRKQDIESFDEAGNVEEDFKLPYLADEIITEGSKYWVYNRILVNSEIYARKGDFPTAISLYKGVYERIIDDSINVKIKANVDYLQEYQKLHLYRKSEAIRQKASEKKGSEIRLSLDGPLTIPEKIQIALTSPPQDMASKFDINKIADEIAEKIAAKRIAEEKKDDEDIKELKEKTRELSKLKDGMLKLHDRLLDIHEEGDQAKKVLEEMKSKMFSDVKEAEEKPVLPEAAFRKEVPEPKRIPPPKADEPEEPEEIEVLSQAQKEDELDGLTDEDIFEKILKDDLSKKKDESFEIVGYNKEQKTSDSDILDKDLEEKQREEEQFYRKFLRHGKRVRKELPILKVTYDFSKLPDEFTLSKDQNILQFSFYKYKPMLEKANELIKMRNVRDAINYYNVVKGQNIPPEFKVMLDKNIGELTEYIEKYLTAD
ncbi:MAG: hypothetical protein JXN64_02570 [Spirochaetes bacterium]|nr:hypothetical protein [Spirochaetota bacterium]